MATFDRFAIVGAYYLYSALFGYSALPTRHLRSRALGSFRAGLTLGLAVDNSRPYVYGQALPKNDDYQSTRDAYARLLRRARAALRADR